MLLGGSYTPELKVRIMQGHGHISNAQTASAVKRFYNKGITHIFLCHLSENNNTPQTAYNCIKRALDSVGAVAGKDVALYALPRKSNSDMFRF
jgi:phosphoribosyl 1,2-cyclic phosphodiesterase